MAPPSGANNIPGQGKKPVVPAIPFNLQRRQPQKQQKPKVKVQDQNLKAPKDPEDSKDAKPAPIPASVTLSPVSTPASMSTSASGPAVPAASKPAPVPAVASAPSAPAASSHPQPTPGLRTSGQGSASCKAETKAPVKATNKVPGQVSNGGSVPKKSHRQSHHPKAPQAPPTAPKDLVNSASSPHFEEPLSAVATSSSSHSKSAEIANSAVEPAANCAEPNGVNGTAAIPTSGLIPANSLPPSATSTPFPDNMPRAAGENKRLLQASPRCLRASLSQDAGIMHSRRQSVQTNGINGNSRAEPVHFPSGQSSHRAPPTMHHSHPSSGHLVFGGFQGSNASSPAPPLSAGYTAPPHGGFQDQRPPPGFAEPNGSGHRRINSGPGFAGPPLPHILSPYGPDFVPTSGVDGYGRPMPLAPFDGYPPRPDQFGPDTPHSFQGSPTPAFPDHENGPMENTQQQHRGASPNHFPPHPRHFPPPMMSRPMADIDLREDLLHHIMNRFNDRSTADYNLEVRTKDGNAPLHLAVHSMIISRSPALKDLMDRSAQTSSPSRGRGSLTPLVMEATDRNVRADALYMAIQHLYGHPLLPLGLPPSGEASSAGRIAVQRLDFALAYAAAGHLLQLMPVVVRGLEIARQYITWTTLEKAVSFAFADSPMPDVFPVAEQLSPRPSTLYQYGNPANLLVGAITDFLIQNWPRNFMPEFSDAKVAGYYERIRGGRNPEAPSSSKSAPIARGTRSARLSSIQFGDVPNPAAGTSGQATSSPESTILSSILLNLPFGVLKYVLESMALSHSTPAERMETISRIILGREARRTSALDKARAEGSTDMFMWLDQGGSLAFGSPEWSTLGWKEDVVRFPENDLPCLTRDWGSSGSAKVGDDTSAAPNPPPLRDSQRLGD